MRKLNKIEIGLLSKLKKRKKVSKHLFAKREELNVEYVMNGNFTVAIINGGIKSALVGVSKFNPFDSHYSEEVGQQLAFARAVKKNNE